VSATNPAQDEVLQTLWLMRAVRCVLVRRSSGRLFVQIVGRSGAICCEEAETPEHAHQIAKAMVRWFAERPMTAPPEGPDGA